MSTIAARWCARSSHICVDMRIGRSPRDSSYLTIQTRIKQFLAVLCFAHSTQHSRPPTSNRPRVPYFRDRLRPPRGLEFAAGAGEMCRVQLLVGRAPSAMCARIPRDCASMDQGRVTFMTSVSLRAKMIFWKIDIRVVTISRVQLSIHHSKYRFIGMKYYAY